MSFRKHDSPHANGLFLLTFASGIYVVIGSKRGLSATGCDDHIETKLSCAKTLKGSDMERWTDQMVIFY